MGKKECPECGAMVDTRMETCGCCGFDLRGFFTKKEPKKEEPKEPKVKRTPARPMEFQKLQDGLEELKQKLLDVESILDDEDEMAQLDAMVVLTVVGSKKVMLYAEYFGVPLELIAQGGGTKVNFDMKKRF